MQHATRVLGYQLTCVIWLFCRVITSDYFILDTSIRHSIVTFLIRLIGYAAVAKIKTAICKYFFSHFPRSRRVKRVFLQRLYNDCSRLKNLMHPKTHSSRCKNQFIFCLSNFDPTRCHVSKKGHFTFANPNL